jgi:flagellar motor switch/type III secretory pathway protein FliN
MLKFETVFVDPSEAVDLAWWSSESLEALRRQVAVAWTRWVAGWVVRSSAVDVRVSIVPADEEPGSDIKNWTGLGGKAAAYAWIAGTDLVSEIHELLFTSDVPGSKSEDSPVANAVAQRACSAFTKAILRELNLDVSDLLPVPAKSLFDRWSGAVVIRLAASGACLYLLLNREAALDLMPRKPLPEIDSKERSALQPVVSALADRKLSLKIELSECEFDFGTLASLREGDVIPLAHALTEPLHVVSDEGSRFCAAHLGAQGAFKAVELLPAYQVADMHATRLTQPTK